MAYKIVVDRGHGGEDPGAVYPGRQEKEDTLRLALEVGRLLEAGGQDVVYTRTTDVYQTPFEKRRLQIGKKRIILFRFTEIPVQDRISIRG